jgi:hypothetical protein
MRDMILETLDSMEFKYQIANDDECRTVIKFGLELDNGRSDVFIDLQSDDNHALIYVICPIKVPENKRGPVSEFLTRANYGIIVGNFEMDFRDGELRYKSSFLYDSELTMNLDVFKRYLFKSTNTLDKYLPGIMSVIYAHVIPADAIAQIENTENPSLN